MVYIFISLNFFLIRFFILLEIGPFNEAQIAYVCKETLTALAFIHDIGIIHRDIKCSNILINENGEIKLADFGVSTKILKDKHVTYAGTPSW